MCEPGTGIVRYVGQARDFAKRVRQHRRLSGSADGTRRGYWLRSLHRKGLSPEAFVICWPADLDAAEKFWIATLRAAGFDLVNTAAGGKSLDHCREAKAASEYAGRQTPLQRAMCAMSFAVRAAKARGDVAAAERLAETALRVKEAVNRAKRREGAQSALSRINAGLLLRAKRRLAA